MFIQQQFLRMSCRRKRWRKPLMLQAVSLYILSAIRTYLYKIERPSLAEENERKGTPGGMLTFRVSLLKWL